MRSVALLTCSEATKSLQCILLTCNVVTHASISYRVATIAIAMLSCSECTGLDAGKELRGGGGRNGKNFEGARGISITSLVQWSNLNQWA